MSSSGIFIDNRVISSSTFDAANRWLKACLISVVLFVTLLFFSTAVDAMQNPIWNGVSKIKVVCGDKPSGVSPAEYQRLCESLVSGVKRKYKMPVELVKTEVKSEALSNTLSAGDLKITLRFDRADGAWLEAENDTPMKGVSSVVQGQPVATFDELKAENLNLLVDRLLTGLGL